MAPREHRLCKGAQAQTVVECHSRVVARPTVAFYTALTENSPSLFDSVAMYYAKRGIPQTRPLSLPHTEPVTMSLARPGRGNKADINRLTTAAVLPEGWHKVEPGTLPWSCVWCER